MNLYLYFSKFLTSTDFWISIDIFLILKVVLILYLTSETGWETQKYNCKKSFISSWLFPTLFKHKKYSYNSNRTFPYKNYFSPEDVRSFQFFSKSSFLNFDQIYLKSERCKIKLQRENSIYYETTFKEMESLAQT